VIPKDPKITYENKVFSNKVDMGMIKTALRGKKILKFHIEYGKVPIKEVVYE